MKFFHNLYSALLFLILSVAVFCFAFFRFELSSVSDDDTIKTITIEPGSVDTIATTLYKNDLIKNKVAFKIYVYITGKTNMKAATYNLSEDMGVEKIVAILFKGNGINQEQVSVTIKEGSNIRKIASLISEETELIAEDFYAVLQDETYLRTLIEKYWFLSEDILNKDIYYSLEGYLYPNTYYLNKTTTWPEIIEKMLDETENQLKDYQDKFNNNNLSIHEIMTMASIIELEGITPEDRKGIASVFINRIKAGMNLGSDVTTYYGAKISMGDRDLYKEELQACNNYNTRCATFTKLPISPICNPDISSIIAVLEPIDANYYYFVADKNKKIYFSKNITEHNRTISNLRKNNLWYEY